MRDRDWKGIAWITASVLVLAVGIIGIIVPVGGAPYCNGKPMSPGDTCVRVVTVGPGTGTKTTSTYDQMRGSNKTDGELLAFVGGVMLLASVS